MHRAAFFRIDGKRWHLTGIGRNTSLDAKFLPASFQPLEERADLMGARSALMLLRSSGNSADARVS